MPFHFPTDGPYSRRTELLRLFYKARRAHSTSVTTSPVCLWLGTGHIVKRLQVVCITAMINHKFISISAVQIYIFFHIFICIAQYTESEVYHLQDMLLTEYITHNGDQLPAGLIAQFVEHCIGIAEVMGWNPLSRPELFSGLNFATA